MAIQADRPGVAVLPPILYGAALVVVWVLRRVLPLAVPAPRALFWLGIALLLVACCLALWGHRTMHSAGTNVNPLLPATTVVTRGPFRYSRNPLYLSLALLFLGVSFAMSTWWGVIVAVPVLLVMHYGVVLREERYLEEKFGDVYRQYRGRVRRYL
jgi:protein-S-isoprenylcysteine O-methyltransferase Ste14